MAILGVTFDDPWLLLGLLALPAAAFALAAARARPGAMRFSSVRALRGARPGPLARLVHMPDALRLLAVGAFIVALARPQTADREVLTGEGVDVVVALDMSLSMASVDMPEDELEAVIASGGVPNNRFETARDILERFVRNREEDRVGLVVFGEEAFLKFPLTLDYARVLQILDGLVLDNGQRDERTGECTNGCTISGRGTAIGDALARAYKRVLGGKAKTKVIVLITDGDNQGGKIDPMTIVDYIAARPERESVRVFTFLVGNDEESFVPARTLMGDIVYQRPRTPYPTNPELLKAIAQKTGGKYYESTSDAKFRADFAELEKTVFTTETQTQHKDVFAPFVLAGCALLLVELLLRFTVFRKFP